MSEPFNTRSSLVRQLWDLGIEPGMVLMVHSSFSKVGWTNGGAGAAIRALFNVLGPNGTLVMPAASPQLSPTDAMIDGSAPDQVFEKHTTPTTMGLLAETFRSWPGTLRSDHPIESVCANGPLAAEIVAEHALEFCEGRGTPFEKLHTLGAFTLLLGVGFNRCTSLHFAESLSIRRRTTTNLLPVVDAGGARWLAVSDMAADNSTHFPVVGARFARTGAVKEGKVGNADSVLFATRDLVNFATQYFDEFLDSNSLA